ncbi:hypothetical protein [Salipiger mucosus]|uniref:Uncharacterized protein n=1 Tax=Salipiger mucosus DSM 16094 TaxID=1123237 RepID=S9QYR8_9RHOB|nr:hypothetical protein [Salipiger mucosus]EPX84798.1 hypothetical protein Salmuc_01371 [Salipiger mucosus DSM 16094]
MTKETRVLCLRLDDGTVQPLAWTDIDLSKKEIRRATRKFRKDADVEGSCLLPVSRLYDTAAEAKNELPRY